MGGIYCPSYNEEGASWVGTHIIDSIRYFKLTVSLFALICYVNHMNEVGIAIDIMNFTYPVNNCIKLNKGNINFKSRSNLKFPKFSDAPMPGGACAPLPHPLHDASGHDTIALFFHFDIVLFFSLNALSSCAGVQFQ